MLDWYSIRQGLFNGNGIARRLAIAVILFSSAITAVVTAIQLYIEYRIEVAGIHQQLSEIGVSQIPAIASSVWALDRVQISTHIEGLTRLADIQYVTIRAGDRLIAEAGIPEETNVIRQFYVLKHIHRGEPIEIGILEINATLVNVYHRLVNKAFIVLATNGVKTFLVAIFMLTMVQWLVTRHLYRMANFAQEINPATGSVAKIVLDRPPVGPRRADALDTLQSTLNAMSGRLTDTYGELRALAERYTALFENSPVGLFQCDADGRLLRANPTISAMLGKAPTTSLPEETGGTELLPFADSTDWLRINKACAEASGAVTADVQWRRADGGVLWVALSLRVARDDFGRFACFEGSVQDIGARISAEREVRVSRDEAVAANRAKSHFLANMSHELRTPLNAVIGCTDMLDRGYLGALTERQQEYVRSVKSSGEHLLSLVNDLLDMSRIEAGKFQLHFEPCAIEAIVEECRQDLLPLAEHNDVRILVDVLPMVLKVDHRAIGQVLRNLLSNAVKFSHRGGTVSLRTEQSEAGLRLTVSDTGIGIAPEVLENIFEPFQRGSAQTSRRAGGSGLGLAISRRLVELHEGRITIDSAPGVGTSVTVLLPAP